MIRHFTNLLYYKCPGGHIHPHCKMDPPALLLQAPRASRSSTTPSTPSNLIDLADTRSITTHLGVVDDWWWPRQDPPWGPADLTTVEFRAAVPAPSFPSSVRDLLPSGAPAERQPRDHLDRVLTAGFSKYQVALARPDWAGRRRGRPSIGRTVSAEAFAYYGPYKNINDNGK